MSTPTLRQAALLAWLAATGLSTALAQTANGHLPEWKTEGPLQYACGGISSDESTAMRAAMQDHPLSLLFARKDGEYLANLAVEIQGGPHTLQFTAGGPICLLQLPAGRYTVQATTQGGATQRQNVEVQGKGRTLDFRY